MSGITLQFQWSLGGKSFEDTEDPGIASMHLGRFKYTDLVS
jgi:hypothetical protein